MLVSTEFSTAVRALFSQSGSSNEAMHPAGMALPILICYIVCLFAVGILMHMQEQKLQNLQQKRNTAFVYCSGEAAAVILEASGRCFFRIWLREIHQDI